MAVKMILAFVIALVMCLLAYPLAIPALHKLKFGQSIREEGPKSHMVKTGTPTMGGLVFIAASILATLIVIPQSFKEINLIVVILAYVGYSVIGFIDDFLIVVKKNNKGLLPRYKFFMQSVLAVIFYLFYKDVNDSTIIIPFIGKSLDLGWFYMVLVFFMFTGTSNAVNLSDGLDGLSSGLVILATIPFVYFCVRSNNISIAIFLCAVIGSLIGYLRFNLHPAKIFMGDTGSLALGGLLAAVAMVTKEELALVLIGGVFVLEALSVIIQVAYFKATHGKRIFRMSPIHHHFELGGMPETKVVYMFWSWGAVLSLLGILMGVLM
ncbi:MAG: phospho-N-acetylmuramoyl-pentapeptide-transferase [Erysipelotrichaceae bacterium]|nr:phospho-N-acetylmuramoyl-pentapeptide-transferase [Erysipelotrichaceae bacterium]MBQ1522113.1 phospho-N-acetylmuramoyl-pentapeptide-transferase [Erysipelotrichaceae bacterium]